jgi:hypothetical protein
MAAADAAAAALEAADDTVDMLQDSHQAAADKWQEKSVIWEKRKRDLKKKIASERLFTTSLQVSHKPYAISNEP